MPFLFVYVCDLLENLGELVYRDCPVLVGLKEKNNAIAITWLKQHRDRLNEQSVNSQAVIAMFMPEARAGYNYGLKAERLERLIARALNLPRNLHEELQMWRSGQARRDLGACVELVIDGMTWEIATRAIANKVTVELIDEALTKIASHNPESSPDVRSLAVKFTTYDPFEPLSKFYKSLGGREAKWLTRLILKDYGSVKFPSKLDFSSHQVFLPRCVQINAEISMTAAFPTLRDGTSVRRGTISDKSTVNRHPAALIAAASRRLPSTNLMANCNQVPTALTIALQASSSASCMLNQLPTPSETAPQPSSPALGPSAARATSGLPRAREPLAPMALNIALSQSFGTEAAEPSSSMLALPTTSPSSTSAKAGRTTASTYPACRRIARTNSSQQYQTGQPKSSIPLIITGTGACRLTTERCPLTNCIFILSPCIASSPYILEQLLPWHGCRIVTSLRSISDPSLPRCCPQTGKKYRKIALIEPNRIEQSVEFLKRIEGLNLRRGKREGMGKVKGKQREKGEKKQWVEVFDWRLLECVAKMDSGKEVGYNVWRRCWMGAA